jgi:DNA-binding GntR family transcriptional regulator
MRELRERGLVASVVGKGTFVIATRSSKNPES